MNSTQVSELLSEEYPTLAKNNIRIVKQFIATDGRVSNTFLIESDKQGFEKFIAKSFVHYPESLRKEFIVLGLLEQKEVSAPRLLIKDHNPLKFLLMEFIDGIPASEAIQHGHDINHIFSQIGETTGKVNSVELETFGSILSPSNITWKEHSMNKLNNKLVVIKSLVEESLFNKIISLMESKKYILDTESQGKPMLVHHDIYLENFLVEKNTGRLILIDYGIVFGGRPLFDLAKFYIWDLSKYPKLKDNFLKTYSKYVPIPKNFNDIMTFYVILEAFGMIDFFNKIEDYKNRDEAINVLENLVDGKGVINNLLH